MVLISTAAPRQHSYRYLHKMLKLWRTVCNAVCSTKVLITDLSHTSAYRCTMRAGHSTIEVAII